MVYGLKEDCGIFGIWGDPEAANQSYMGLHSLQHRGQEGAGIVTNQDGKFMRHRDLGLLSQVFSDPNDLNKLAGNAALGHVRYATAGNHSINNIQPLVFQSNQHQFALAHNGNIMNAKTLRDKLETNGLHSNVSSDSVLLGQLIQLSDQQTFLDKLKDSLSQLRGGFAFTLITEDSLIATMDPNGFHPLIIGQKDNGAIVIASESCALDQVGAHIIRDVKPGEIIIVNDDGIHVTSFTDQTDLKINAMEYIYFAQATSTIFGVNVHEARVHMGRQLAKEAPTPEGDVVVGVPSSSLAAALGYAQASGIPYNHGLLKNQYVARTFIEPNQKKREHDVAMKLTPIKPVIKGKNVVLIDDSIVRGTTSRYIVKMLKESGAKSVHVRIASPTIKYPCYDGVDFQHMAELIGAKHDVSGIANELDADSLSYLSVDGLVNSIGLGDNICTAYFDGHYPLPLYDYQASFDHDKELLNQSEVNQ